MLVLALLFLRVQHAITRSGVADTMETLARVDLSIAEVKKQAENWCDIDVGRFGKYAPADDKITEVSYPLAMEPYSKMIVSIMAKRWRWVLNTLL